MLSSIAATANTVTYSAIRVVEEVNGLGHLNNYRWTVIRFDIVDFRVNGTCYMGCRLRFSLDAHLPNTPARTHIGIDSSRTVMTNFAPPAENLGDPTGYAGVFPFPSDMNDIVAKFTPAEKLAIAWIVVNSEELIHFAVKSGVLGDVEAESWGRDAKRFERDLRRSMPRLRPYIRSLE